MKAPVKTVPELTDKQDSNFWRKVQVTGFCWLWTAGQDSKGYGQFTVYPEGKFVAHKVAYILLVGNIPERLELDHLCRIRNCVNPDHLEPVSASENLKRRKYATKHKPAWVVSGKNVTGKCIKGHEYTEVNTYTYPDGRTECRSCKRDNRMRYALKARQNAA